MVVVAAEVDRAERARRTGRAAAEPDDDGRGPRGRVGTGDPPVTWTGYSPSGVPAGTVTVNGTRAAVGNPFETTVGRAVAGSIRKPDGAVAPTATVACVGVVTTRSRLSRACCSPSADGGTNACAGDSRPPSSVVVKAVPPSTDGGTSCGRVPQLPGSLPST